jgi:hypothetical protein
VSSRTIIAIALLALAAPTASARSPLFRNQHRRTATAHGADIRSQAAAPVDVSGDVSTFDEPRTDTADGGDTLLGPFVAAMSIEEVDTLAARMRFRPLARDVRYAGDSTLRLHELRDTTVRGVLIYALTFERGLLQQVEIHRNVPTEDSSLLGSWLMSFVRTLSTSAEPMARHGDVEVRCRQTPHGAITTQLLLRGSTYATIIASVGPPRADCQRC